MADQRMELFQNLVDSLLSTPGDTSSSLRETLAGQQETSLPPEIKAYVTKVARHAYKVTDADIEALRNQGYSEDAIFEITLSASLGASMKCLSQGLAAIQGAKNAPEGH